jgi:chromate transporter
MQPFAMTPSPLPNDAPTAPSFWQAFAYWLWLGCISFGGPAGQIALMHEELVEKRRWISQRRFQHALNYCMLLPGPEAQQLATYLGWLLHRTRGGLVAGTLFVLPSLFILMGLSWVYMVYGQLPAVAAVLYGIKPAVTAIVVAAAWRLGVRTLKNHWLRAIALLAFVAIFALRLPFPLIVLAAGLFGYLGGRFAPHQFAPGGAGHAGGGSASDRAVVDDDTPTPEHARFNWARVAQVLAAGLGLWLAAMGVLVACNGWSGTLTQMAWFFTKAALLTFGGAYAVLPYVYQGAVEHFHWLTPLQMMDGLALGETTPGPLIMLVSFVGFVGGWTQALGGSQALWLGAVVAGSVVTFFTFLPSFVFIFLGAPLIESTHGNLKFTAPLTGIAAAVVGVILNLALFFAWHVLWPQGFGAGFEWPALAIAAVAALALLRYQQGVMRVVLGAGLAGLAIGFVGS